MKISDELRQWSDESDSGDGACDELRELADRIDREMVELPKDRDGKIIHIGDTVYRDGVDKLDVYGINLMRNALIVGCMNQDGEICPCFPTDVTHERHDSLERIADDIEAYLMDNPRIDESTLCDWAVRIRNLAKKESK